MPLYEYRCSGCGVKFDKLMRMSDADGVVACPTCGGAAKRQVSLFAAFSKGDGGQVSTVGGGCAGCSAGSCASCGHH